MASDKKLWWQTGVIYQIYPRSFQDSNGDGIGDLPGIIQRLDYLSDTLGIDAIWLSPFYPSPMADFGYDVADYCDVDPMFGTLADFDRLVAEARKRSIAIVVDLVPNHTSDQHPWFIESRSSRHTPKRDWYIWRDARPDSSLPNNWLSNFGGPAWEWDQKTQQYYLHSFLKEQPDLNWRNPAVKAAMFDAVRFWLERGVAGFRLDVAHYIMKDPDLRDNPPNPHPITLSGRPVQEYDRWLHINDKGHPDVHQVLREFRAVLNAYEAALPRYSVGEIHIFDWNEWVRYYGQALDELHMPFNFALLPAPWQAQALRRVVDGLEGALPPGAWPNYVLGNHDEPRLASRYGREQARVAAMLLLTLRGTPTLYQGDELGMVNGDIPFDKQKDPWGLRMPGLSRDVCRTPMQWSDAPNAGFAPASVQACWLPVTADYHAVNVERELNDPTSFLSLYRRLLTYRRATPALQSGSYRAVERVPEDCFVFERCLDGQRIIVALNLCGQARGVALPDRGAGEIVVSTALDRSGPVTLAGFTLRGNEGLIITP